MDRTGSRLPADEWYLTNWDDAVRADQVSVFQPVTRRVPTELPRRRWFSGPDTWGAQAGLAMTVLLVLGALAALVL